MMKILFGMFLVFEMMALVDSKQRQEAAASRQLGPKKAKRSNGKKRKNNNDLFSGLQGRSLADIRFNKCPPTGDDADDMSYNYAAPSRDYPKGVNKNVFPLLPSDYPLSIDMATTLKEETMADSVILVDHDYQLKGQNANNASYWLRYTSMQPMYPGDDVTANNRDFWDELRAVVEIQIARRNGDEPSSFNRWPDLWKGKSTLNEIAEAVNGEYPLSWQTAFLGKLFTEGAIQTDTSMFPSRGAADFVSKEVRISAINAWAFDAIAAINFMLKWNFGVPRPEEMAWLISDGELTSKHDGVPEDLVAMIKSMELKSSTEFTAYENGAPTHPSYPAMHSAGSTMSYWLPVICLITPEQYCEALRVDYAVSYGRTIAGVHYPMDNIAGLGIGRGIIREQLPDMLADKYGYDSDKVASKLEKLSIDFSTFDSKACTIDGVSAADFLANASSM